MKNLFECRRIVFIFSALLMVLLLFAACITDRKTEDDSDSGKNTSDEIDQATEKTKEAIEKELESLLLENVSKDILSFYCEDYEANGTFEAFALVGEVVRDSVGDIYEGELWFVNDRGAEKVSEEESYWSKNELIEFDKYTFLLQSRFFVTSDLVIIWSVKDGKPHKEDISEQGCFFKQHNGIEFTMAHSAYDMSIDAIDDKQESFGIGHTYKEYYFYFDPVVQDGFDLQKQVEQVQNLNLHVQPY